MKTYVIIVLRRIWNLQITCGQIVNENRSIVKYLFLNCILNSINLINLFFSSF